MEEKLIALIDRFIDFTIRRHRLVLAVLLLLTVPMVYFYTRMRHYNNIEIYFDADNADLLYYRQFQERYGNEELVFIAFKDRDIFTAGNIALVRSISDAIGRIRGVQRVLSLTEAKEAVGEGDLVSFKRYFPKDREPTPEELRAARAKILAEPVYRNSLISADGTTTGIAAEIESLRDDEKREVVKLIMDTAMKSAGDRAGDLHLAGVSVAEVRMNEHSQRDFRVFQPVTLSVIFILVAFTLRNMALSMLTMANLLVILAWGMGVFIMTGETFNMLMVAMGPMLLSSAVESSVHTLSEFEEDYVTGSASGDYAGLVRKTIKMVWAPCFMTSLTTSMGFISFGPANVQPVQTLGIYTSIGVMLGFIITMIFMPASLMLLENHFKKRISWRGHRTEGESGAIVMILTSLVKFVLRHYRPIAFITLSILAGSTVVGIARLHFETNTMRYLLDSDPTKRDVLFIEKNLGGAIPFAIVVRAKSEDRDFSRHAGLRLLDEIQRDLMKKYEGRYTSSFSIADYFRQINRAFNGNDPRYYSIPRSKSDIADFYEIGDPDIIDRMITSDRMEARISIQTKWGTNEEARRHNREIAEYMAVKLGNDYTYHLTGLSTLYVKMETNLMTTQITSFALSFVMIFAMMFLVCRNFTLSIISMLPNIFPIFLTLGLMGLLNMPFDVATIMIGGIALGIVVDDTTHYMVWFRRNMMAGMSHADAIVQTFKDVGRPTFIISIVLCCGFGVLVLASIKPTINFGILSAFTLLIAPLGDYLMLPALILLIKPKVKR